MLRARFQRPLSDPARIRTVQASVAHLAAHPAAMNALPGEGLLVAVAEYVHSNLPFPDTASRLTAVLDGFELRFWDPKSHRRTVVGMRRTARMVSMLRMLVRHPELADPPGELGALVRETRELVARPGLDVLPPEDRGDPPWWRLLRIDRVLRHEERATIERLMLLIFEMDAITSMAEATADMRFVLPEVCDGPLALSAESVYHPFLERPVANPLHLDQEQRLLFLTGPNMAGKTTYLRACGIALYLAHVGMGVPARSFRFSPCDDLFTAITLVDNVRQGVSFFRAEALRVREVAQALADGRRVVAFLDEPFKGTNVKDALDASLTIFDRLSAARDSLFLVSSHLIEVAEPLQATGRVRCARFDAAERAGRLDYDFTLRPGISTQRLGQRVLEEEGVFELLGESVERRGGGRGLGYGLGMRDAECPLRRGRGRRGPVPAAWRHAAAGERE